MHTTVCNISISLSISLSLSHTHAHTHTHTLTHTHTHTHKQACLHTGSVVDPDNRDASPAPSTAESVANFIKTYFKGVSTTPSIYEACLYTVKHLIWVLNKLCMSTEHFNIFQIGVYIFLVQESPDWNPVLDRHPHCSNIIMGLGFSGLWIKDISTHCDPQSALGRWLVLVSYLCHVKDVNYWNPTCRSWVQAKSSDWKNTEWTGSWSPSILWPFTFQSQQISEYGSKTLGQTTSVQTMQ